MRLLFIFPVLIPCLLSGQRLQVVRSDTIILPFQIRLAEGRAFTGYDSSDIRRSGRLTDLLTIRGLLMEDADLKLKFDLVGLEEGLNYNIEVNMLDEQDNPVEFESRQLNGISGKILETPTSAYEYQWRDITEMEDSWYGDRRIIIRLMLEGADLDCSLPPKFRYLGLHGLAGGVDLGLIGLGGRSYWKHEDAADLYFETYARGGSQAEGRLIREDANDHRNRNLALNAAGIAVLVINGAVLTARLFKHIKKKRRFNKYCSQRSF